MQRQARKQKGITLVALVITIIVLLLLAGVTISLLVGENGIITKAKEGGNRTQQAQEKEKIELAVTASIMEDTDKLTIEEGNLNTELINEFGGEEEYTLTNNQDGSFLIRIEKSKRTYYIGNSGEVIGEENMKKISNAEELKAFRDEVNSGNSYDGWYVYLTDNITLNNTEIWEPIGLYPMNTTGPTDEENNKPFKGIFDGKNHTINGININTTDKGQGFFGIVYKGTIKNITIGKQNNFTVGGASAGIVGYLYNGSIYNCTNESDIASTGSYVGGIAGFSIVSSKIEKCYNKGNITSDKENFSVGGIVGQQGESSMIIKCMNDGIISAYRTAGGIVGHSTTSSSVIESFNMNNISVVEYASGGICGDAKSSNIKNCYNIGDINGNKYSGGIVGFNRNNENTNKIPNIIINCYNIGNITGNSLASSIALKQIGLVKISNCYYLENTLNGANETNEIEGVILKTSEGLKGIADNLGSAFKTDTNNINNGYPILSWQE